MVYPMSNWRVIVYYNDYNNDWMCVSVSTNPYSSAHLIILDIELFFCSQSGESVNSHVLHIFFFTVFSTELHVVVCIYIYISTQPVKWEMRGFLIETGYESLGKIIYGLICLCIYIYIYMRMFFYCRSGYCIVFNDCHLKPISDIKSHSNSQGDPIMKVDLTLSFYNSTT